MGVKVRQKGFNCVTYNHGERNGQLLRLELEILALHGESNISAQNIGFYNYLFLPTYTVQGQVLGHTRYSVTAIFHEIYFSYLQIFCCAGLQGNAAT